MAGSQTSFQHALELVHFICQQTADHFRLYVAAYPEFYPQANSAVDDISFFQKRLPLGPI